MIVYIHRSNIDGKPFYVGLGKSYLRARNWSLPSRSLRWFDVARYGYTIDIIKMPNVFKAKELEGYYIQKFGRRAIDKDGTLVNKAQPEGPKFHQHEVFETINPTDTFLHPFMVWRYERARKKHMENLLAG